MVDTLGGVVTRELSAQDMREFVRSFARFPLYLEDFYDLLLETLATGVFEELQAGFREILAGSLVIQREAGMSSVQFLDPSGFVTEVERAGSGVVATFPILLGLYRVQPKGTLVVEEPEAHLEPAKQMQLLELLVLAGAKRGLRLVITTHSDYVVRKCLALVSRGILSHRDIGLYYFDRPTGKLTTVYTMAVDRSGHAEQPLFQEAMEKLIAEYARSVLD
jgi:predicted ATPase